MLFAEPAKIKQQQKTQLADPENEVFVSAVSTWEIPIKLRSEAHLARWSTPSGLPAHAVSGEQVL